MADSKESEKKESITPVKNIPSFNPGDTVRVMYRIIEGKKTRVQPYEGIVISKKGKGQSKTFTVRRIGAGGIGVERIFPLYSPNIEEIKVLRTGKVRRAKLYYLREKKGREAMKVKSAKKKVLKKKVEKKKIVKKEVKAKVVKKPQSKTESK